MQPPALVLTILTLLTTHDALAAQAPPPILAGTKIWDRARHCAFGDIIRWRGEFLATFREGTRHVHGMDGKVRIIAASDGATWAHRALLSETGIDLRDPKLSVMPDDTLMMTCGGSDYSDGLQEWHTRVAYSKDGKTWTPPRRVRGIPSNNWFFRLTWHKGVGYCMPNVSGADPRTGRALTKDRSIALYRTTDGMNYRKVGADLALPAMACEATLRFKPDDTLVAIIRLGSQSRSGFIVRAAEPYTKFTAKPLQHGLGGPNLLLLPDGSWLAGTREYGHERPKGRKGTATVLLRVDEKGGFERLFELQSGGDTSYPGMLLHAGELWMTYYSSHETSTAIYLARIPIAKLVARGR